MTKTAGFNVYLGTPAQREQCIKNLTIIAEALRFDSAGQLVKWLATRDTAAIVEALKPIRKAELAQELDKLTAARTGE